MGTQTVLPEPQSARQQRLTLVRPLDCMYQKTFKNGLWAGYPLWAGDPLWAEYPLRACRQYHTHCGLSAYRGHRGNCGPEATSGSREAWICGPLPTVVTIPTVGAVPTAGLRPTGGFLPTAGLQPIVGSKPSRASHIISLYSSVCPTMPGEVAAGGAVIPVGQDQAGGAALQAAGPVGLQVVRAFAIHQPAQVGLPDLGEGVPIEGCREGAAPDLAYQLGILTDVADQLRGAVQGFRAGRVAAHQKPVSPVFDQLRESAYRAGQHQATRRHGFHHHDSERFRPGLQLHQEGAAFVFRRQLALVNQPAVRDARFLGRHLLRQSRAPQPGSAEIVQPEALVPLVQPAGNLGARGSEVCPPVS